jgi:excinuclease ABC subunit A
LTELARNKNSVIAPILNNKTSAVQPKKAAKLNDSIRIIGAEANNLKKIDVSIPLHQLVCLTGVSGSGKSSLAIDILYKALWSSLHDARMIPGKHIKIEGIEKIKDVYCIDQSPVSKSKISIPATYIGVFDAVRKVFAECDGAVRHELNHISYYSFNSEGGCSSCKGVGYLDSHIHYLGDVQLDCPVCNGKRYSEEVLEVFYKGKNIAQVLEMTVEDAVRFFNDKPYIYNKLKYLYELGLEYMTLGQSLSTISGGEAQRLGLAREISKVRGTQNMLYILDEPTTGLHSKDIQKLLQVFAKLIEKGNSVLLIEHNPDVILSADHVIDIGPGAGNKGGEIVVQGAPDEMMACKQSYTGQYLNNHLGSK